MSKKTGYRGIKLDLKYIILIAIIITILLFYLYPIIQEDNNSTNSATVYNSTENYTDDEEYKQYFISDGKENSNEYITEILVKKDIGKPTGITIDDNNNIWFSNNHKGYIIEYNTEINKFTEYKIPLDEYEQNYTQIWSIVSNNNSIWFTEAENNLILKFNTKTSEFSKYEIPTPDSFPLQLAIDDNQNIWFTETYGKKIGKISKLTNGEYSNKIIEIDIPGEIDLLGGLDIDNDNNIWFNFLSINGNITNSKIGQLNQINKEIIIFDVPRNIIAPVGIAVDSENMIWIADHGSNFIAKFNPKNNKFNIYSTSIPDNYPTSLPYWIEVEGENVISNEHWGNKILQYNKNDGSLIEYNILTENPKWNNLANVLKISQIKNGEIWFTEMTENKIAKLNTKIDIPFTVRIDNNQIKVNQNTETEIELIIEFNELTSGEIYFRKSLIYSLDRIETEIEITTNDYKEINNIKKHTQIIQIKVNNVEKDVYNVMLGIEINNITKLIPVTIIVQE